MSGLPKSTVERAFEIAGEGDCQGIPEIAAILTREHPEAVDAPLAGPAIRRDLTRRWEQAAD